jgi:hypothetical protein
VGAAAAARSWCTDARARIDRTRYGVKARELRVCHWSHGGWTWTVIGNVQSSAHLDGSSLGVIFISDLDCTDSMDWYRRGTTQGRYYQLTGVLPELYTIEN